MNVGRVAGYPGDDVVLDVRLSVTGTPVVATQNELHLPHSFSVVSCRANTAIRKDATLFTYLPQGCQRGVDCSGVRTIVFSLIDSTPIPNGAQLYTCTVRIGSDAAPGNRVISCADPLASAADATAVTATCAGGSAVVASPVDVSLMVGGATAAPGQRATVDVSIEHDSNPVGTQNDLRFPPQAHVRSCTMNSEIMRESSRLALLPQGCTPGVDCNAVRALVFSFAEQSTIPTGSVLYSCKIDIDPTTPLGTVFPIDCSNAGASDADANRLQTDCRAGAITVADPVVSLDFGRTAAAPGERAVVPLIANALRSDVPIVGVRTDFRFSPDTPVAARDDGSPECQTVSAEITTEEFSFQPSGCTPGTDCTAVRAEVSTDGDSSISDGVTLFECAFDIPAGAKAGSYPIRHVAGMQVATDDANITRGTTTTDGEIVIRSMCVGDCNGDFQVPISELVTGVNVLLDNAPIASCLAFDRNLNGAVTVDELVTGIGEALRGCSQ